jgi:transcriptional regulator with XRE-family HTH domain
MIRNTPPEDAASPKVGSQPPDVALGQAIRLRRQQLRMSQSALAEACGISFQQIQKYERGSNRVSFSRLLNIAQALGCRPEELMGVIEADRQEDVDGVSPLSLIQTRGATELLAAYARLGPEQQQAILGLLRAMAPAASQG